MIAVEAAFSTNYAQARVRFLEAAAIASSTQNLQIESFNALQKGKDGGVLALDAAFTKPKQSQQNTATANVVEKLLIVSSAADGGRSFGGSAAQVFALHDAEWMNKANDAGVAALYLHGLAYVNQPFASSLALILKKYLTGVKKLVWLDASGTVELENGVNQALEVATSVVKYQFSSVKGVTQSEPAWQGQTISLARQAMFQAVDALNKD
jgi:Protein of unknown function (DUF2817)